MDKTAHFLASAARHIQIIRAGFKPNDAESNIGQLSQKKVHDILVKVTQVFWARNLADRIQLRSVYLQSLTTIKLVADDVFVEAMDVSQQQAVLGKVKKGLIRLVEADIREQYRQTIEVFLRGHPFLITSPTQRKQKMYPVRSKEAELASVGILDQFLIRLHPFHSLHFEKDKTLVSIAADQVRKIKDNLDNVSGTYSKDVSLSVDDVHALGSYFMLLQLFLSDLREIGGKPRFPPDYWYQGASDAISELRQYVFGLHNSLERKAIESGDLMLADQVQTAGNTLIDTLTRIYSVRVEECSELWAFRTRRVVKKRGEVFLQSRILVGANGEQETLQSYLGRGNPDGDVSEGMDVGYLLDNKIPLADKEVTVLGEFLFRQEALRSLATNARISIRASSDILIAASRANRAAVQVEGVLDNSQSPPVLDVNRIDVSAQWYLSSVGYPMPQSGKPSQLDLAPSWRRPTKALKRAAQLERNQYSVPGTIEGQERLFLDLLSIPEVLKAIRRSVGGKKAADLTAQVLHDHDMRGSIWRALFSHLYLEDQDHALDLFLEYQQRYLDYFTRHTMWNVRDRGTPYYDTVWPQGISGRALYDCGVYSVLVALDLYRTFADGEKKFLRFGFVTILNHITLVAYTKKKSLFLNNSHLLGPIQMQIKDGKSAAARAQFSMKTWGPGVFADTYNVRYSVALVRVPHGTIQSTQGDRAFKRQLWRSYLRYSKWWGIQPGIADTYHEHLKEYDLRMRSVEKLLSQVGTNSPANSQEMLKMSEDTKRLFDIADILADPDNFGERPEFKGRVTSTSKIGLIHPPDIEPPIYKIVRLVEDASKTGETLSPEQDALLGLPKSVEDHATELNQK